MKMMVDSDAFSYNVYILWTLKSVIGLVDLIRSTRYSFCGKLLRGIPTNLLVCIINSKMVYIGQSAVQYDTEFRDFVNIGSFRI